MEIIRESSKNEVITFYKLRQIIKGLNRKEDWHFKRFPNGFHVESVDLITLNEEEFKNLVYLDSNRTRNCGLVIDDGKDYRLLKTVAQRAREMDYINNLSEDSPGHRMAEYRRKFLFSNLLLSCEHRIIVRSLINNEREKNPSGTYYIHDGNGRCLPYMILIQENQIEYKEVECYYCKN